MDLIFAPTDVNIADQVIETLATYVIDHGGDTGAEHQRSMLLAALLRRLFDLSPMHAIHLARRDAFDPRVQVAGQARDEILNRIRSSRLTAQSAPWTPQTGDTVTHNGTHGTWIFQAWEDDDTAWIHRPDARTFPTTGRAGSGLVDLAGWRDEPEDAVLVAVAELRPATDGQDDADESALAHYARTGHLPNFGCCVTAEQRAAAQQRWNAGESEVTV